MQDLTCQTFGDWTVIKFSHRSKNRTPFWECKCICGTVRNVNYNSLVNGKSRSCGCTSRQRASKKITTHGESKTRLYKIWKGMRKRCCNPNDTVYKFYGGRGVSVCKEWSDFEKFSKWALSHGYANNLTIDRIDVNGNYEPDNCRWADTETQHTNTRRNRFITLDGETHILRDWSTISGVPVSTIIRRLKDEWVERDAIFVKAKCGNRYSKIKSSMEA